MSQPSLFQQVLDYATLHASDANSARSWLAVAVLMQAQGNLGPARSALDRARSAGLNDRVIEWMATALPESPQ